MKSLKKNFAWNFLGLTSYNFSQWLLLLILARIGDQYTVGRFSLMLAISAPVYLALGMNLRLALTTDVQHRWRLAEYFQIRRFSNLAAVCVTLILGLVVGLTPPELLALGILAAAKVVEATSQVYYAMFQRAELFVLVSRSLVARAALGPTFFFVLYVAFDQLWSACLGLLIGWMLPQLILDRKGFKSVSKLEDPRFFEPKRPGEVRSLFRKTAPLGLDQGVSSLAVNVPRYAVQYSVGTTGLAVYSSLAYFAQIVAMVGTTMGSVFNPRLARLYRAGNRAGFIKLLSTLVAFAATISVGAGLGAILFGDTLIRWTLGPEYVDQDLLTALMVSAGLITLHRSLCKVLESSQSFGRYLALDLIVTITVCVSAPFLVASVGPIGAAYSTIIGYGIGTVFAAGLAVYTVRRI